MFRLLPPPGSPIWRRVVSAGALAAGLGVASSVVDAQPAPVLPLAPPAWLAGCWELRAGARVVHEQWMAPAGGVMLGMSRTIVRDTVREWEHLMLGPTAQGLVYLARPSRQEPARFPVTVSDDTLLVMEDPAHDFPQRIRYRRVGRDSVVARIEGEANGRVRGVDFPMARVGCP